MDVKIPKRKNVPIAHLEKANNNNYLFCCSFGGDVKEVLLLMQALLYMIKVMEAIVDGPYVVVYFHTLTSRANHPPMSYMKLAYSVLDHRSVIIPSDLS